MRTTQRVRALGTVLCDKRVQDLEMFSLMRKKMLRRDVRAVFKYLEGCHVGEGQTCSPGAWTTERAPTADDSQ